MTPSPGLKDPLAAQKLNKKDTVPPHKSITRGSSRPAPKPEPVKLQNDNKKVPPKKEPQKDKKKQPVPAKASANGLKLKAQIRQKSMARAGNPYGGGQNLPKGYVSKGLKMPSGGSHDQIQRRLKNKSPWYQSILDPMHGADCKIPDETGIETGTLQLVQKFTWHTHAGAGVEHSGGGFRVVTPYINKVPVTWPSTTVTYGGNVQYMNPNVLAVSGDQWGAYDPTGDFQVGPATFYNPFDGIEEFQELIDSHRIVSFAIYVQPEASLATNEGEYTLYFQPMSTSGSSPTNYYGHFANYYKSVSIPMNSNSPGVMRWAPIDRTDESFKAFFPTFASKMSTQIGDETAECPFWEIGVVADGCEPGIAFRTTVVVNYEFVPRYNSLNIIDSSPSPSDATEVDLVENWVQDMDVGTTIPLKKISSSPSTVSPEHGDNDEGTGFGMFFNVIKELAPLALAFI